MRRRFLALALVLGVAGCGSATGTLDAGSAGALGHDLAVVRADAARGARGPALAALEAFSSRVAADARAGRLTAAERAALDTGIARVRATIGAPSPHTTPTTTPTAPQTTTTTVTQPATAAAPATQPATPAAPAPPGPAKKGKKHGGKHGEGGD